MKGALSLQFCSTLGRSSVLLVAGHLCSFNAVASPTCGETAIALIPQGWSLLSEAHGDLGRDRVADIALVAEQRERPGDVEASKRRLIVAEFRRDLGKYCVHSTDDRFVAGARSEFMEEPFGSDGVRIDRGLLLISFETFFNSGSWNLRDSTYRFRKAAAGMRLIGYDATTTSRATHAESVLSVNFLTGELHETTGPVPSVFTKRRCPQLAARQVLMADIEDSLSYEVDDSLCVQASSGDARPSA